MKLYSHGVIYDHTHMRYTYEKYDKVVILKFERR